ncbi:AAA family ATPase [Nocardia stercoris]|uniref:ATP-binding protein n=1 Tax=Nocardia stercoris TaxID=2483361 RepID=A0A3M2LF10_9NOCA|nr:AAA family ATPase [Nocardia stercoris]RMI35390.1 ATP-binding protein [Nocardia stercoris]
MLLWINGPFGGGKTQTAFELQHRVPDALVCDPEEVGFGLQRVLPKEMRTDFQEFKAWRQGVVETLDAVLSKHDGTVIAPMTVVVPAYFDETVGRLRELGHDVHHFTLLARPETVRKRLKERGLYGLWYESWALGQVDRCLDALQAEEFAEHIHTDHLPIREVADRIAASAGLPITPNTDTALRRQWRRLRVGIEHMRLP